MITGDVSGHTKVLDLLEGRDIYTISGHHDAVTAVKFSKDGEYFVTGSKDKHLMVFKSNITVNLSAKDDETESSFEELSAPKHMANKENHQDAKEPILVDSRKSVNYNYLINDDVVEV
jgi:centriolar protein POC1